MRTHKHKDKHRPTTRRVYHCFNSYTCASSNGTWALRLECILFNSILSFLFLVLSKENQREDQNQLGHCVCVFFMTPLFVVLSKGHGLSKIKKNHCVSVLFLVLSKENQEERPKPSEKKKNMCLKKKMCVSVSWHPFFWCRQKGMVPQKPKTAGLGVPAQQRHPPWPGPRQLLGP